MLDFLVPMITSETALKVIGSALALLAVFLVQRAVVKRAVIVAVTDAVYDVLVPVAPVTATKLDDKIVLVLGAMREKLKMELTAGEEKIATARVAERATEPAPAPEVKAS